MKAMTTVADVERFGNLVNDMMSPSGCAETDFSLDWIRKQGWKAIPVESMGRIPIPDIPRIVGALRNAGFSECLAVYNELGFKKILPLLAPMTPPGDTATCYVLSIDETEFRELNRQLGVFRFVLTTEGRDWAISCADSYNVFGAKPELLESMLGKSTDEAHKEFREFASVLAKGNPDYALLRVAQYYVNV